MYPKYICKYEKEKYMGSRHLVGCLLRPHGTCRSGGARMSGKVICTTCSSLNYDGAISPSLRGGWGGEENLQKKEPSESLLCTALIRMLMQASGP